MKILVVVIFFGSLSLNACEIPAAQVSYEKGAYQVAVEMLLDAPAAAVKAVLTDHANLSRISETFTESVVLNSDENGLLRRRLHIKTCILFFCFDMDMVEDIKINPGGAILTTIVPELSDFNSGHARWQIENHKNDGSRVRFSSKRQPSFWIPPVIGPWMLKRKVIAETTASCRRIEAIARTSLEPRL